jgi:FMN-dependent NADH-azoreductase
MRLLHIISTPRGHESNTIRVANVLIEELYAKHEDLTVEVLDLFKADLPAVAGANIESKYKLITGQELDDRHRSSWEAIEANIQRFMAADIYVISTPMWNFGIPYALKYYIDAIIQPGYLYRFSESGVPEGLVKGKRMVVVASSGGDYSADSPLHAVDFLEPYLRTVFSFVGIANIDFIRAQPMDISPAARRAALLKAYAEARALVNDNHWEVAAPAGAVELPEEARPAPLASSVEA